MTRLKTTNKMTRLLGLLTASAFAGSAFWTGCGPVTPFYPTIEIDVGKTVAYKTTVPLGVAFGAGAKDLGPAVPSVALLPILDVSVRLTEAPSTYVFHTVKYPSTAPGPDITLINNPFLYTYVRDPDEQFTTLITTPVEFDEAQFREWEKLPLVATAPWTLPYAAALSLPTETDNATVLLKPALSLDYWLTGSPPQWKNNGPLGPNVETIRALRLVYPGICSAQLGINSIFPTLNQNITDLFLGATVVPTETGGQLKFLQEASVLPLHAGFGPNSGGGGGDGLTNGPDIGGFVLQGNPIVWDEGICEPLFGIGGCAPCDVHVSYYYQFTLSDGRLTVLPAKIGMTYDNTLHLCTGSSGGMTFPQSVDTALSVAVPQAINNQAKAQQLFSPDVSCGDAENHPDDAKCCTIDKATGKCPAGSYKCDPVTLICHDVFDCSIGPTGPPEVSCANADGRPDDKKCCRPDSRTGRCAPGSDVCDPTLLVCVKGIESQCGAAISQFAVAVGIGETVLGIAASDPSGQLAKTAQLTTNWQCTPKPTPQCLSIPAQNTAGRCQFIVRAKRLVVDPQTVTLVWFDDPTDFSNPSVALFAATFFGGGLSAPPNLTQYQQLCSRFLYKLPGSVTPADNKVPYQFQYAESGDTGVVTGSYPVPPSPPIPPQCACQNDAQCGCGALCASNGACTGQSGANLTVCTKNSDCLPASDFCYTDIQRCATFPSACSSCSGCQVYETCTPAGCAEYPWNPPYIKPSPCGVPCSAPPPPPPSSN